MTNIRCEIRSIHVTKDHKYLNKILVFRMVKQNVIDLYLNKICSKPAKENYDTNKTVGAHIDNTWSLDFLDMIDYGIKNIKGYRYVLVVIVNFSEYGFGFPMTD